MTAPDARRDRYRLSIIALTLSYVNYSFGGLIIRGLESAEFVLAPVWVWIFIDEVPRLPTLIGGSVVLLAVAGWAWAGARGQRGTLRQSE